MCMKKLKYNYFVVITIVVVGVVGLKLLHQKKLTRDFVEKQEESLPASSNSRLTTKTSKSENKVFEEIQKSIDDAIESRKHNISLLDEIYSSQYPENTIFEKISNLKNELEKSSYLAEYAKLCCRDDPDKFLIIFDSLAPGTLRENLLLVAVENLDIGRLHDLVMKVNQSGDENERNTIINSFKIADVDDSEFQASRFNIYNGLTQLGEINDIIIQNEFAKFIGRGIGKLDATKVNEVELTGLEEITESSFYAGFLETKLADDGSFNKELIAKLTRDDQLAFASSLADHMLGQKNIDSAIQVPDGLNDEMVVKYVSKVASSLVRTDSLAYSRIVSSMKNNPSKDLFIREMVDYLSEVGDFQSAKQWDSTILDERYKANTDRNP